MWLLRGEKASFWFSDSVLCSFLSLKDLLSWHFSPCLYFHALLAQFSKRIHNHVSLEGALLALQLKALLFLWKEGGNNDTSSPERVFASVQQGFRRKHMNVETVGPGFEPTTGHAPEHSCPKTIIEWFNGSNSNNIKSCLDFKEERAITQIPPALHLPLTINLWLHCLKGSTSQELF